MSQKKIFLNSDLGEGFGNWKMGDESKIMPYVDMANLACGFHAGDPLNISKSIDLAIKHNCQIGAHPGYWDLVGFGRRSIPYEDKELEAIFIYQIGALRALCKSKGSDITYVKPHGALYNDIIKDEAKLLLILNALSKYDNRLKLMILSTPKNSYYKELGRSRGVDLIFEVFADRGYDDNGFLVKRGEEGAVIHDLDSVNLRIKTLKKEGYITSIKDKKLYLEADTICVHGDNENAVQLTKEIREALVA